MNSFHVTLFQTYYSIYKGSLTPVTPPCVLSLDASRISLIIAFIMDFSQKRRLIIRRTQEKTPICSSQQMPKNRRALPVRCGTAGANDASLYPANWEGARVLPFQRQTECRPLCLPVLRTDFRTPNSFVFRYPYNPHTRSTLRDNRVQRERWGNYTIFILRTANSGLSARVSDNRSLHSYHCKEKKAHSLYYL